MLAIAEDVFESHTYIRDGYVWSHPMTFIASPPPRLPRLYVRMDADGSRRAMPCVVPRGQEDLRQEKTVTEILRPSVRPSLPS